MVRKLTGTKRNIPPFRCDIVGSFLRTEEIKIARRKFAEGDINFETLTDIENTEIIKLVQKEKQLGLKAVTDGEFRRSWWHLDFFLGIHGTEKIMLNKGKNINGSRIRAESFRIVDKILFNGHPMIQHFKYLQSICGSSIPKFTIPSPALFYSVQSHNENNVYKNSQELMNDIIEVYKCAIQSFYEAGCRYLQLDDTALGMLCSQKYRQHISHMNVDPEELMNYYLNLINGSTLDCPDDMIITLHICRGNFHSSWFASGGYDFISETIFKNCSVDGFFLEYDDERSGDFKPLRFIKKQIVVLGLVTTKHGGLESKQYIKSRISEACKYIDINQLCLSPQCGFASTEEGNIITEEEQWDKIRLIVEIAGEVWNQ
ncbi:5-methyltetrahydropteroyltriglutamate--homocysteine S-methyltransferase [Clostridium tyrobutyricum]|uniref:5-methyltetrahydropteroyltriglutamate-- homocysteine S-methyltransferase n=1 Tax=Clostridium tyrobutyricum TaxID=1519 RepID=UPI000301AB59|nr:5-methyltetrahydropteroyltriglutamate--homocysteine S-methyltransferase [Clostridium tyrobutyricum]MBV4447531.1 5-methyltetrahydropteroyltriglutamate--homocysteine S-methyltransferase [Clostridium tyrobutyricum]MEA5009742.1 5-methyltetrahydropteroyltriglutamate--homocysteine S-methyltransferase [Clostridium tyrobutyricum]